VKTGDDFSPNIRINKLFRNLKVFSKDIKIPIASYEADERDGAIGNVINFGNVNFGGGIIGVYACSWINCKGVLPLRQL